MNKVGAGRRPQGHITVAFAHQTVREWTEVCRVKARPELDKSEVLMTMAIWLADGFAGNEMSEST